MSNALARKNNDPILIQDARIVFRNFSGKPGQFNAPGQRNFNLIIPEDTVGYFEDLGFNVKRFKPRDGEEQGDAHVKVNVNLNSNRPPKLNIINSRGRTTLTEDMIDMLDWADFAKVDILINPYRREWPDGRVTVTPYLQTFFGTIREDELELMYSDVPDAVVPDSAQNVLVWESTSPDELEVLKMQELEG